MEGVRERRLEERRGEGRVEERRGGERSGVERRLEIKIRIWFGGAEGRGRDIEGNRRGNKARLD